MNKVRYIIFGISKDLKKTLCSNFVSLKTIPTAARALLLAGGLCCLGVGLSLRLGGGGRDRQRDCCGGC